MWMCTYSTVQTAPEKNIFKKLFMYSVSIYLQWTQNQQSNLSLRKFTTYSYYPYPVDPIHPPLNQEFCRWNLTTPSNASEEPQQHRAPNQCSPNPCNRKGTVRCEDKKGDFQCHCFTGWAGLKCEEGRACQTSSVSKCTILVKTVVPL